ncbi:hypothetical protein GCM10009641_24640 [Mycobacterium cookii]|uniref:Uncharacterized protein n=1 Tax=Mycobacterium cookii TaxID=1775 RepID=A0A7I7KT36_9MYCO|nr:hypothetical protein [Mycobacterium cookii]MCV7331102.1 hypothetical protein [Mycobacterium cookii]BBX44944.1 hypothetical protein MCOO_09590 [Mycobacterium cookii]
MDVAATIATYAAFLGVWVEQYEPITWAEQLIETAQAVDHPRLAFLYVLAAQCWTTGRIETAVRYTEAAQQLVIGSGGREVPFGFAGVLGSAYLAVGQPERWAQLCRAQLARGRDAHAFTRTSLVLALAFGRCDDGARAAANGVIDAAEATDNPYVLSFALYAYGLAFRDPDPAGALNALRRGLMIAQDSGNRYDESLLTSTLSQFEAEYGDPLTALDYFTVAIRNYHDAGNTTLIRSALAILAALVDRLGRYEPAATIAGFAISPLTTMALPEFNSTITHLREVLGDPIYESLARKGETMTTAAMATYAYDQIDQARAGLEDPR